jgi:uncharacterized cupin superfamily protein
MTDIPSHVINVADVQEIEHLNGEHWGGAHKPLTPSMRPKGGHLGVRQSRLPPGRATCPFHYHQLDDEAFFILSGRGVLRYGDDVRELRPGDCVSCPAGTKVAHQIANPFDVDLLYLGIGMNDPNEVCVYPDAGKILVRSLQAVGVLKRVDYMEGEAARPKIFDFVKR